MNRRIVIPAAVLAMFATSAASCEDTVQQIQTVERFVSQDATEHAYYTCSTWPLKAMTIDDCPDPEHPPYVPLERKNLLAVCPNGETAMTTEDC